MRVENDIAMTRALFPCSPGVSGGYTISDAATAAGAEGTERVRQQPAPAARSMPVGGRADDVRQPSGLPESVLRLAATDSALGCARREVRRAVDAWGLEQIVDVVELLVLELVRVAMGGPAVARRPCYRDLRLFAPGWKL